MSKRVVLLGVDGLDWACVRRGIEGGTLPTLARILAEGARAEVAVSACVPGLAGAEEGLNSPTLWTTIATGQYYFQHGVYDFTNLLDSIERPPLFESRHVAAPRLWDVLGQYDVTSLVVGYYVTHPAYPIRGVMVSDLFGETAAHDVVFPAGRVGEVARLLDVADYGALLPETNAESRLPRIPVDELRNVLQQFTDLQPTEMDALLAQPDSRPARLLEYRLAYPLRRDERLHRVFTKLLATESWGFATVYYRLADFVSHGFWTTGHDLPADHVRAYSPVVDRAYAWLDARIGEVWKQLDADDVLMILSDHGFTTATPPGESAAGEHVWEVTYGEHAEPAVLMVVGAQRRGCVENVTLLDIAPSVLDYFGVPQAAALDGGAIPQLLHPEAPRALPRVACYPYEPPAEHGAVSSTEQRQVEARLAALGYMDEQ